MERISEIWSFTLPGNIMQVINCGEDLRDFGASRKEGEDFRHLRCMSAFLKQVIRAIVRRGSWPCETSMHFIFLKISSEMAVKLPALRVKRTLPIRKFLALISVRGSVDTWTIERLKGLGKLKNPVSTRWVEPATFGLVGKLQTPKR